MNKRRYGLYFLCFIFVVCSTACNRYYYSVYDSKGYNVEVYPSNFEEEETQAILEAFFLNTQYDGKIHHTVYFKSCIGSEKCGGRLLTMIWSIPEDKCDIAVAVFQEENQYRFNAEPKRCY